MELKETKVTLRKLTADEGKVIVSKEMVTDENGKEKPLIRSKEIYLGIGDNENNYVEIEEKEE